MIDKLHYISQADGTGNHIPAIEKALKAGCSWIQLRIKDRHPGFILDQALEAKILCDKHHAKLIVNDHPEIALAANAYGLHLGLSDMPIAAARDMVGPELVIGGTANTYDHVIQRIREGADYVGLGPYRFTPTKKNLSPILGLAGYTNIMVQLQAAGVRIPIIAIGGLTAAEVPALIQAGLYGTALSAAITFSDDAKALVTSLYTALNKTMNH